MDVIILVEHAEFRKDRNCTDQVFSITTHIEAEFE